MKMKSHIKVLQKGSPIINRPGTVLSILDENASFYDGNISDRRSEDIAGRIFPGNVYSIFSRPRYKDETCFYPINSILILRPDTSPIGSIRVKLYLYFSKKYLKKISLDPVREYDLKGHCQVRTVYTKGCSVYDPLEVKEDVIYDDNMIPFPPHVSIFDSVWEGYRDISFI